MVGISRLAEHDYERMRLEREQQIESLQDAINNLEATKRTCEHQMEQFAHAVKKYKADHYNLK